MKPQNPEGAFRLFVHPILLFTLVFYLTGCGLFRSASGPKPPLNVVHTLHYRYSADHTNAGNFRYEYNHARDPQKVRNEVIEELITLVDNNYYNYEVALRDGRTTLDLGATLAAMGTSAAAAVAGGEATKTVLAAISTGVIGAEAAVNKTVYKDLATEAIISEMRRLRSEQEKILISDRTNTIAHCDLDTVLKDINRYYHAGFVTSALTSLAANAGERALAAQTNVARMRLNLR